MYRKHFLLLLLLCFLSGCWDSTEIEDIGVVTGLGLDTAEDGDKLMMVNQYVVPVNIPGQQNSSTQGSPYQNIRMNGNTFFEIIRDNALESNRPPNYTHLKSILASTHLFEKERVDQVIDVFIRDHEFRRTVPVFITQDSMGEILNTDPAKELFPSIQIKSLGDNYHKNTKIPKNLSIGDMSQYISENKDFFIPGVSLQNGKIRSSGAGIISAEKSNFIGWLASEDIEGIRYIYNDVQGGFIYLDEEAIDGGPLILEVKDSSTSYQTKISGDTLQMTVSVEISTFLAEDWSTSRDVYKKSWNEKVEKAANQTIEEKMKKVIDLAQNEYETDFLHLSTWVSIHEPKFWNKHKKDWNETFTDIDVKVEVKTKITNFGTQNYNKDKNGG